MKKFIELTQSQIKAYENGATMFIFPITDYDQRRIESGYSIGDSLPVWKGDKDVWIKEEFFYLDGEIHYNYNYTKRGQEQHKLDYDVESSQMTKEQSRYSFEEVLDVKIVRVQDINWNEITNIMKVVCTCKDNEDNRCYGGGHDGHFKQHYNKQMQEQNINRTYEDNGYVFLIEIKSN